MARQRSNDLTKVDGACRHARDFPLGKVGVGVVEAEGIGGPHLK